MKRACLFLLAVSLFLPRSNAQEKTWLVGVGGNALLDTYLSQEHYKGIEIDFLHEMTKPYKRDSLWSRTNYYHLELSRTRPRSKSATDYAGMFDYSFGMHRTFTLAQNLTLAVGGQADVFIGGVYNTRNGNNPAQLKLGFDIAPSVRFAYKFRIRRQQLRLNYRADLPLIGLQFSPAYGQSYYEIFSEGYYDHNVCFTSVFSAVNYFHRLTFDIFFRKTALTFGYLGTCRQSTSNSIKYHSYSHAFVLGFTI